MKRSSQTLSGTLEECSNKLISKERQFNKRFDWLLEGIQIIDFNWCYVYVNDLLTKHEKSDNEILQGHSITERYPDIEHTEIFSALQRCMTDRKQQQIETEIVYYDKSKKWFEINIEPVDEGIMVLSLDISKRVEAEEKIDKGNRLCKFISQINQKIVRVKDEATLFRNACSMALEFGKFKMAWIGKFDNDNQKITMVDQCGIPVKEIKLFFNVPFQSMNPQKYVVDSATYYISNDIEHAVELAEWKPYALKHGIRSCMVLPIKKSGKIIGTFNLYATELNFSGKDEIALLVELASDISFALDVFEKQKKQNEDIMKRKRAEEKLLYNNDELQKANSELDRFVYSASHDLRAPLCSVLGLVSLIETESKENTTLEYAGMIRTSVNRLDGFIRNILKYSKNNRLELEASQIPLQKSIKAIVDLLRNMSEAKGLDFEINIDEQQTFYSDPHRFNIIVENLISNAIKFQDHNRKERFIKIIGKSDGENFNFKIADNGIGIPLEYQHKIFDMFFRVSSDREGAGIGLYIVKETVAKLQGSIQIDSKEHVGTTFTICLKNLFP